MKRRYFCVIMIMAFCLALMPASAFAAEPLWNAEIIETHLQASGIRITDDGFVKYYVGSINDEGGFFNDEVGLINDKGEYVYTRYPEWRYEDLFEKYQYQYIYFDDLSSSGDYIFDANNISRYAKYSSVRYLDYYDANDGTYLYYDYKFVNKKDGKTYYCSDIIAKYMGCNAGEILMDYAYSSEDGRYAIIETSRMDSEYNVLRKDTYHIDISALKVQRVISSQIDVENANISPPSEGLMSYTVYNSESGAYSIKELGYLDGDGEKAITLDPKQYKYNGNFSGGFACVQAANSQKYGFIDKSGQLVISCIYKGVDSFKDGYACVANSLGKYGVIDTFDNTVIPFEWDYLNGASNGLFVAEKYDGGRGVCLIDKNGTEIISNAYSITGCKNNTAYMLDNDYNLYVIKLTPAVPGIVNFICSDGNMSACIMMPDGNKGYAFCVCYDASGRLLSIKSADLKSGLNDGLVFEKDNRAATAKLFVIDGSSRPLFEAREVRVK